MKSYETSEILFDTNYTVIKGKGAIKRTDAFQTLFLMHTGVTPHAVQATGTESMGKSLAALSDSGEMGLQ